VPAAGGRSDIGVLILHLLVYFLRSWDRASLMYLSITNKMQRYTMIFVTVNALLVSGGSSAHHQELKLYTQHRVLREQAVRSSKSSTNTRCCVYSFELLMMGGGTA
jgi:hypothetical protein